MSAYVLKANKLHIWTDLVYTLSSDSQSIPTWTDEPAEPPILQVCAVAGWPSGWLHSPPPLALTPFPSSSPSLDLAAPANAKVLSIGNTYSVFRYGIPVTVRKNSFKRKLLTFLDDDNRKQKY